MGLNPEILQKLKLTEEELVDTINSILDVIFSSYKAFAYFSVEDLRQECFIFAFKGLPDYKPEIGLLKPFLYKHILNRLNTFKRDKYYRNSCPCSCCLKIFMGELSGDGCVKYRNWLRRTTTKSFLATMHQQPDSIDSLLGLTDHGGFIDHTELHILLLDAMPDSLKVYYNKLINGEKISDVRLLKVQQFVLDFIKDIDEYEYFSRKIKSKRKKLHKEKS